MTAIVVRKDNGKVHEVPVEIVVYRPDSGMTFLWRSGLLGMRLRFLIEHCRNRREHVHRAR